jgi:hypothetical protein
MSEKNGFKQVIEARWKCPYCNATGKRWLRQKIARKNARCHISKHHREERNSNQKPLIIETRKVGLNKCVQTVRKTLYGRSMGLENLGCVNLARS